MANKRAQGYVFLVDDEPIQNEMLHDFLAEKFNYSVKKFSSGEEAVKELHLKPRFVVVDYHLNGKSSSAKNGIEVLKDIRQKAPKSNVIMLSGQDKIEVAIDSLKHGAKDYVIKGETAFARIESIFGRIAEYEGVKASNASYRLMINTIVVMYILFIGFALYQLITENLGIQIF